MKTIQVAALLSLSVGSVAFGQQPVQWRVQDGGNGHWYQVVVAPGGGLLWDAAQAMAVAKGAHLATLTSSSEWGFTFPLVGSRLTVLGAFRNEGPGALHEGWQWVTGEPWAYSRWFAGEPNGCDGGSMCAGGLVLNQSWCLQTAGSWNDAARLMPFGRACGNPPQSLIEWSADCNTDGIVDYGQCRDGSLPDYNGNNIPDCCEQGTPCVVGSYPVQWRVSEGGNGHWYAAARQLRVWSSARADAQSVGGYLATTTSQAELQFLRPMLANPLGADYWLGGSRVAGANTWAWITDEPFVFTAWEPGEPDNLPNSTCLEVIGRSQLAGFGMWNDEFPDATGPGNYSLIEWSADCNNDGIVDKGQILAGQLADSDNDGTPNVCECVCDVFRDFNVNGIDLGILLGQWGPANQFTVTDFNGDGVVDGSDLGQLLATWGPCPN
jgi:hypothetical protein